MYFFPFSTWGFFFYVTALGLRVSGLGTDVLFWFFDLTLLFLCYCAWCKGVGFRLWCLFWFFDMRLLFLCYIASFKGVGFRFGGIFCFFYLRLFFLCYCDWFKSVGFRFWCFFWGGFSTWGFFFYVTGLDLRVSGLACDLFFWFFDLRLVFLCYK